MAGITLVQAQANLDAWVAASIAVAAGQSYQIGDRQFSKVNAEHIDRMILFWQGWVDKLTADATAARPGGIRFARAAPR